jgi:hypothetical protein
MKIALIVLASLIAFALIDYYYEEIDDEEY